MDPRKWDLKWVAAFAAAAVVGAIGVVVVLSVVGGHDDQATAQSSDATPVPAVTEAAPSQQVTEPAGESAATATAAAPGRNKPELPTYPAVVPTLPPDFTLPEKRPCPAGWGLVTDDMAGYSICVAPGWGMPDASTGEAMVNVVLHYGEAYIYSPEAFPRPLGNAAEAPVDPEADFLTIVLFPIPADTAVEGGCEAKPGGTVAGLPAATCEYRFDPVPYWDQAITSPSGKWTGLRAFVPLPSAKPPTGPDGQPLPAPKGEPRSAGLGISAFARNEVMDRLRDRVAEILATLQILP